MCQITLSKTEKVNFVFDFFVTFVTAVTIVTVMKTIMQPFHKKSRNLSFFFLLSQYFWKEQFVTHDNRCDFLRAASCDSRDIFNNDVLSYCTNNLFGKIDC